MSNSILVRLFVAVLLIVSFSNIAVQAQKPGSDDQFGPVVRSYLGYLKNEQNVVDDRVSRREISESYYRRNSNRIRALRQMAVRLANETQNDYLPELEAVASDEFGMIFERRPRYETMRVGEVYNATFRYLGSVRAGEVFYLFARLDPYEQAEWREKLTGSATAAAPVTTESASGTKVGVRARRVNVP